MPEMAGTPAHYGKLLTIGLLTIEHSAKAV